MFTLLLINSFTFYLLACLPIEECSRASCDPAEIHGDVQCRILCNINDAYGISGQCRDSRPGCPNTVLTEPCVVRPCPPPLPSRCTPVRGALSTAAVAVANMINDWHVINEIIRRRYADSAVADINYTSHISDLVFCLPRSLAYSQPVGRRGDVPLPTPPSFHFILSLHCLSLLYQFHAFIGVSVLVVSLLMAEKSIWLF